MPNTDPIPPNGFRTFVIVWITQSISVFGTALTFFAINIWLTQTLCPLPEQKPQLALALSAVSLAFALPVVFGAPVAGAWADRHDRKHTMIAMDFISGVLSLILVALILTQILNLWLLVVLVVMFSIASAFHSAAFDTSYVMIVSEAQLPRANGMMQTMWSLSGVLSPVIAASLIAVPALARQGKIPGGLGAALSHLSDGTALAIGIDALTFFIASAVLLFLFIPSPKRTDLYEEDGRKKKSLWSDVKIGGLYIWQRKPLLWLLGTFVVANFVDGPMAVFQPLLVKFNFAADWTVRGFSFETALALLTTMGGIGGLVGGIFVSAWGGLKTRRVYGVLIPLILGGIAQVFLGLSSYLYIASAMVFISFGMVPLMNSHSQTIWQTQTSPELQGRVFAVRRLIAQFTWPLSTAMAGWAGGLFDPGKVVAVLGLILTVFCIAQLFNPYLLRVEDKAFLDELAGLEVAKT
jgi:MFS transporter, DHA3 family, macrolide efflux protein